MKKIPLLPRCFRWIGILIFLLGLLYHLSEIFNFLPPPFVFYLKTFVIYADGRLYDKEQWFTLLEVDFGLTFILVSYLLGLTFIAFSRNKVEDEMINSIRWHSWSWSIILTIIFNFISTLFIYGTAYLSFAGLYIQFLLLMYIILFWINIWKMNRRLANEE